MDFIAYIVIIGTSKRLLCKILKHQKSWKKNWVNKFVISEFSAIWHRVNLLRELVLL